MSLSSVTDLSKTFYFEHKERTHLDTCQLTTKNYSIFSQSLKTLTNSNEKQTSTVYQSSIQTLATYAAWLSQENLDELPLKVFGEVVSQIKEFPLGGEWGIFLLCCRKVKDNVELLFSMECEPPLADLIRWKLLPPLIVEKFIKTTTNTSVISLIFSATETSLRTPTFALVHAENYGVSTLYWHPGDISKEVTGSFKLECKNAKGPSYTPTFVSRVAVIQDQVYASLFLEKRNTLATIVLGFFNPRIEIDTHQLSATSTSVHSLEHFTQFDKVEGHIPQKGVNISSPSITFTFPSALPFHLLWSSETNYSIMGFWSAADQNNISFLDKEKTSL